MAVPPPSLQDVSYAVQTPPVNDHERSCLAGAEAQELELNPPSVKYLQ